MARSNPPDHHSIESPAALGLRRHNPVAVAKFPRIMLQNKPVDPSNLPLKDWMYKGYARVDARNGRADSTTLDWLKEGKILMSREFFCGGLDDISLEWEEGFMQGFILGYTEGSGWNVKVRMDPRLQPQHADDEVKSLEAFAATLLHELCHAMLHRYSCNNTCSEASCRREHDYETGPDGHGFAWRTIKWSVDDAWEEHAGFKVDL